MIIICLTYDGIMMKKQSGVKRKLTLNFKGVDIVKEDIQPISNQPNLNKEIENENKIEQKDRRLLSQKYFEKLSKSSFIPRPIYRIINGPIQAHSENEQKIYQACLYNSVSGLRGVIKVNPFLTNFSNMRGETLLHTAVFKINQKNISTNPEQLVVELQDIKCDIDNIKTNSTQVVNYSNNLIMLTKNLKAETNYLVSDPNKRADHVEMLRNHIEKLKCNPKEFAIYKEQLKTHPIKLIAYQMKLDAYIKRVGAYIENINADLKRLEVLLKNGIDPNKADKNKNTPLHLLVKTTGEDVTPFIKILYENGANVNALNNEQQTPLDITLKYNNYTSAAKLKECGGVFNLYRLKHNKMLQVEMKEQQHVCILLCFKEKYQANRELNLAFLLPKVVQGSILQEFCRSK